MAVKYYCDRCGVEIEKKGAGFPQFEMNTMVGMMQGIKIPQLCVPCNKKLQDIIDDFVKNKL